MTTCMLASFAIDEAGSPARLYPRTRNNSPPEAIQTCAEGRGSGFARRVPKCPTFSAHWAHFPVWVEPSRTLEDQAVHNEPRLSVGPAQFLGELPQCLWRGLRFSDPVDNEPGIGECIDRNREGACRSGYVGSLDKNGTAANLTVVPCRE